MKLLRQFLMIVSVSLLGEALRALIPLPIPASVYGLVLLFAALMTGVIRLEQVKDAAELEDSLEVWAFGRSGVREGSGFGRLEGLDARDLGARAKAAVERRRGVVARCVAEIRERL